MNEKERDALKEKMLQARTEITGNIDALKDLTKPIPPDDSIGRLTRMEAINSKSINEAALSAAKLKLGKLESALKRIDTDPDFGLCLQCEEPIPVARLLLMPEATQCVKCAAS